MKHNEDFSLNLSLSLSLTSLSLSLTLSLSLSYIDPPWEGAGAILSTTPHPTMILNAITIPIFITINVIIHLAMLIISIFILSS